MVLITTGFENMGDFSSFELISNFFEDKYIEIALLVGGKNLLEFQRGGNTYTTRWKELDNLVLWLKQFMHAPKTDPFPIDVEDGYAVIKADYARKKIAEHYLENPDVSDEQMDLLEAWENRHSWLRYRGGAILSDIMFEYRGDSLEISWDNRNSAEGVDFTYVYGGAGVPKDTFIASVNHFVEKYEQHWNKTLGK